MSTDLHLKELLLRWEEAREQGQQLSPEELCQDCPGLLERLRQRIAALEEMDSILDTAGDVASPARTAEHIEGTKHDRPSLVPKVGPLRNVLVPGYEILGELGRGGMGVVYRARQLSLNRQVALKMVLSAEHAGPQQLARFCAEAEAVAHLQHPNIVTIYEVATHDGRPYIALELVEGGCLDDHLGGAPQPARQAAEMVETLARTIHYAHERGIVHRDMKPGNILFQFAGPKLHDAGQRIHAGKSAIYNLKAAIPKITDFGLAMRLDSDHNMTRTGTILGTPCYMAPEQAAGKVRDLGRPVDVYALGAILYEILTGRPPLQGATSFETIQLVMHTEPMPPRRLQPNVPRDLEIICMKCLRKDPAKRYATAQELADDLRRFLNSEPILGRPTPTWERALKYAQRRPAAAALFVVSVLAIVTFLVMGLWYHSHLQHEHTKLERALAENKERLQRLHVGNAVTLQEAGSFLTSIPWLVEALNMETDDDEKEAHRVRIGTTLRLCPRVSQLWLHKEDVNRAAFSPDGRRVVTASNDGTARLHDAAGGETLEPALKHEAAVVFAAFSPNNQRVATASEDRSARVWNASSRQPLTRPLKHDGPVAMASFSPDSRWLVTASADKTARIWAVESGQPRLKPLRHDGPVLVASFSPDGAWVLTASADGTARVWDAATGKPRFDTPLKHRGPVCCAGFSPDGKVLATGSADGTAQLWDAVTGAPTWSSPAVHQEIIKAVTFSRDGKLLGTASADLTARLWDVATGKQTVPAMQHYSAVYAIAFSQDSKVIATCGDDNTARIWDATNGRPVTAILNHNASVRHVALSPDPAGRWLLTASDDHTARIYDLDAPEKLLPILRHQAAVVNIAYAPGNSGHLVTAGEDHIALIWDTATGTRLGAPMQHKDVVRDANFSPDGSWIATASNDRTARLWNAQTGKPRFEKSWEHGGSVIRATFSPNGAYVVTASQDGTARVWNVDTGGSVAVMKHDGPVHDANFSPDGRQVVTASEDHTARLWDLSSGKQIGPAMEHKLGVTRAVFSNDGRAIVTAGRDQTARLWETGTGRPLLAEPLHHVGRVFDATFDPQDKIVVTCSDDNSARVWDAATGRMLVPPLRHYGAVTRVAFSPKDGHWLATASNDNMARVWDVKTGEPLTPPLIHPGFGRITDVAFHPEAKFLSTASADGTIRIWDLRPTERSAEDLALLAKIYSGSQIDPATLGLVPLSPLSLRSAWLELTKGNR